MSQNIEKIEMVINNIFREKLIFLVDGANHSYV